MWPITLSTCSLDLTSKDEVAFRLSNIWPECKHWKYSQAYRSGFYTLEMVTRLAQGLGLSLCTLAREDWFPLCSYLSFQSKFTVCIEPSLTAGFKVLRNPMYLNSYSTSIVLSIDLTATIVTKLLQGNIVKSRSSNLKFYCL